MGRDKWALVVPLSLSSLETQTKGLGDSGKEAEGTPIPCLGCLISVVTGSEGVGPGLAWAGKVAVAASQARKEGLTIGRMATGHLYCCLVSSG